ncbi:peptidylprolyl isomerase [Bermanella sp. R86510]|uniref:peptidylprolyl isomerase n=1 Tax=unclassified Bermanella TaxID=2627862 RepID=UPI0037C59BC8
MKNLIIAACSLAILGCSNSDELATVGSKSIDKSEFSQYMEAKGIANKSLSAQKSLLENYVHRQALTESIEMQGAVDTNKIDQQVKDYRDQLLLNAYFDAYIAENVTDEAIKNYYSANADQFEKEKSHVAHILLRLRSGMTDEEVEVEKLKAFEIHSKLKKGEDFADLANQESDDKISAKKGGDLGWIVKGSIDPVFSKVAFELEEGQVSEPIRTAFGFHILKVLEAPKTVKIGFNDVKGEIRHTLKAKAKQAELERLKSDVEVEIFSERLLEE